MVAASHPKRATEAAVIEVNCTTCGEKVGVQSLLAAAKQPCEKCGHALMGPMLELGAPGSGAPPWQEPGTQAAPLWFGSGVGVVVGLVVVVCVALMGPAVPLSFRGAIVGALMGVVLAPVIAIFFFLSSFLPFSLEGVLGDSLWTRLAKGLRERRIAPLILPTLIFVVLPMAACGLGGTRAGIITTPALVTASVGAILLGAIIGGLCGIAADKSSALQNPKQPS
jgi:hypothetical protein